MRKARKIELAKIINKPSVDIYLDDNYDRFDTNIEFYIDPTHSLAISIDPSGDIAWAYLWGEHKDHGSGSLFKRDDENE
jgi:hypothetical protein